MMVMGFGQSRSLVAGRDCLRGTRALRPIRSGGGAGSTGRGSRPTAARSSGPARSSGVGRRRPGDRRHEGRRPRPRPSSPTRPRRRASCPIRRRRCRVGREGPDGLDPLVGRRRPGSPSTPGSTISAWTPTGLATTGSPAAWYWRTFRPHLPRLQRSSGSQLIPIVARGQLARPRSPRPRGRRRPAVASKLGEPVADHPEPEPGDLAAQPLPERPAAAPGPGACSTSRSRRGRRVRPERPPACRSWRRRSGRDRRRSGSRRTRSARGPGAEGAVGQEVVARR